MNTIVYGLPLWLVLVAGVFVIAFVIFLIIWALREGREVVFWPPRIGPRLINEPPQPEKIAPKQPASETHQKGVSEASADSKRQDLPVSGFALVDAVALRQILVEHFDLEEMRTLCFDLDVDFDNLRGEGKGAKARELAAHLDRRGQLGQLVEYIRQHRPDIQLD